MPTDPLALSDHINFIMKNRIEDLKWWQKAVFYQIYPRSFWDSNGDGIGDLMEFESRLDYLQELGVDAIWLSPHYPSPLFDIGYDIADYTNCAPEYGSMEDFRRLLEGVHRRGMKLILDLVLNHTSFEHAWFQESRSRRDNPKRDWYIWREGIEGNPPNNWVSSFGGSAWEFDPITLQYYYHFFLKEQPDLNWRNPQVKQAMFDIVRFWLDIGVDGYRLDAIGTIFEHPAIPDAPMTMTLAEHYKATSESKSEVEIARLKKIWDETFQYQVEQPGMHGLMKELRQVVDEYPERVLVGENDDITYHGEDDELHMVFNFPLMKPERLTPAWIRQNQAKRLSQLAEVSPKAWPCNTLGNHDSPRVYNRFGDGKNDAQLACLSLALMLTLRGTPFLYYGEEIGMTDLILEEISQFRDMLGIWIYEAEKRELSASHSVALKHAAELTRDKCRTPMQWANAPNAGFCPPQVQPWLPIHPGYFEGVNVEQQKSDNDSLLEFYRRMLNLRKSLPALIAGDYRPISSGEMVDEKVLAFLRNTPGQTILVAMNFSITPQTIILPTVTTSDKYRLIFSTRAQMERIEQTKLELAPFEVAILEKTRE
jgi:alpha-glucosidase